MIFVHRNNLPVCIFRRWTWASLNFGELNLYRPPQLKNTRWQEKMWPIMAEEGTLLFQDHISIYDFCHNISMSFLWGWESRTSSKLYDSIRTTYSKLKSYLNHENQCRPTFFYTLNSSGIRKKFEKNQAINQNQFDTGFT